MRLSSDVVACFAASSRDFSPLHMSDSYARTTPFGQRVVHGACAVLACCGSFIPPPGYFPSALRVVFYHPVFLDIDYGLIIKGERVAVMDGSTQVMDITLEYLPGIPPLASVPDKPAAPLGTARAVSDADLTGSWETAGTYSPGAFEYLALLRALGVDRQAWGDALPIGLMASSYLTGMEMPGERALYFRLQATFSDGPVVLPSAIHQAVTGHDSRWSMVKSRFRLSGVAADWCSGEMQAFLLPVRSRPAALVGEIGPEVAARFSGKVALVVGASRGFGASLAMTLAAAGATVVALYARSTEDAQRLKQSAQGLAGEIILMQGDASDPATCSEIRRQVVAAYGRLDWLICGGTPSLVPLRIETAAFERIDRFVRSGFALVLAPLAAFLELLSASEGTVLMISSSYVEESPALWPHYVALKSAIEGLTRVAAAECRKVSFCIARPAKLDTDLVNTPMGRLNAENPATAALRILSEAASSARPGEVCYLK